MLKQGVGLTLGFLSPQDRTLPGTNSKGGDPGETPKPPRASYFLLAAFLIATLTWRYLAVGFPGHVLVSRLEYLHASWDRLYKGVLISIGPNITLYCLV